MKVEIMCYLGSWRCTTFIFIPTKQLIAAISIVEALFALHAKKSDLGRAKKKKFNVHFFTYHLINYDTCVY